MLWKKIRKNTYNLKQLKEKIDTRAITSIGKKSYSVEKKKSFKSNKGFNKSSTPDQNLKVDHNAKKKILLENLLSNKLLKISSKKITSQQEKVSSS